MVPGRGKKWPSHIWQMLAVALFCFSFETLDQNNKVLGISLPYHTGEIVNVFALTQTMALTVIDFLF